MNGLSWQECRISEDTHEDIHLKNYAYIQRDHLIYVYGGLDHTNKITDSFFVINLEEIEFEEIFYHGMNPGYIESGVF